MSINYDIPHYVIFSVLFSRGPPIKILYAFLLSQTIYDCHSLTELTEENIIYNVPCYANSISFPCVSFLSPKAILRTDTDSGMRKKSRILAI